MNVRIGAGVLVLLLLPAHAFAGTATEAVQPFYAHPGLELEASARDRFVDPAFTILNQNDAIKATGEEGCLDPALAFDDTDYDLAEVTASLNFSETVNGQEAKVFAAFKAENAPHRMQWRLRNVDGAWKIADLVSMTGDWALSQFNCQ
jgi:hypothetical protein